MTRVTRRALLAAAVPLGGLVLARAARAADACVQPDSESLRASLNYVNPAPDTAVACAHCAFFTASAAGGSCGDCRILGGTVDAGAHCDSFSPPA